MANVTYKITIKIKSGAVYNAHEILTQLEQCYFSIIYIAL